MQGPSSSTQSSNNSLNAAGVNEEEPANSQDDINFMERFQGLDLENSLSTQNLINSTTTPNNNTFICLNNQTLNSSANNLDEFSTIELRDNSANNNDASSVNNGLVHQQNSASKIDDDIGEGCASWSPPIIQNSFWANRFIRPRGNDPDVNTGTNFEDSPNYENGGGGAGTNREGVVVVGGSSDDDYNLYKRKEPLDKSGKDPPERQDQPGELIPWFYQILNCNRHFFIVSPDLNFPVCRARFLSRIMFVKSIQWIFLTLCVVMLRLFPETEIIFLKAPEIAYLFMMVYMTSVVAARAADYAKKPWGALLTLYIETICLLYINGQMLFSTEEYVLPAIVFTITLTNTSLAILCYFSKADVSENSSIYSKASSIVLFGSMLAMALSVAIYPPVRTHNWIKKMVTMSLLNFMISLTYILMELSDIHFILRGYRFAVTERDWLVVAASLF